MNTSGAKNCSDLQQQLENAKESLVVLNDNIKRIVGRPARHVKDPRYDKKYSYEVKRSELDSFRKSGTDLMSSSKRGYDSKSVFTRLSAPFSRHVEAEPRPKLTSRVIREMPSRQEIVAVQCADSASKARNRRIFGSLLGTLQKFSQEESRFKQKEEKKVQIEKKIEEQEVLERVSLRKGRDALFHDRKQKQIEIKCLEQKIFRIKDFEMWENSMNNSKSFIKTKTKPSIFYRPRIPNAKTDKLLLECQNATSQLIQDRKEALNKDLKELEDNFKAADMELEDHTHSMENDDLLGVRYSAISTSECFLRPSIVVEDEKNFEEIKGHNNMIEQ